MMCTVNFSKPVWIEKKNLNYSLCAGRFRCLQLIKTLEYLALLNQLQLCRHIGLVKCCFLATKTNGRWLLHASYMWNLVLHMLTK